LRYNTSKVRCLSLYSCDFVCTSTAGPAAAATTERSWDATDNQDTDFNAAAVEEAALGAQHTANAHIFQQQFAPTCHPRFNRTSDFSSVIPYADSC
jgi:hypothetical protein